MHLGNFYVLVKVPCIVPSLDLQGALRNCLTKYLKADQIINVKQFGLCKPGCRRLLKENAILKTNAQQYCM